MDFFFLLILYNRLTETKERQITTENDGNNIFLLKKENRKITKPLHKEDEITTGIYYTYIIWAEILYFDKTVIDTSSTYWEGLEISNIMNSVNISG